VRARSRVSKRFVVLVAAAGAATLVGAGGAASATSRAAPAARITAPPAACPTSGLVVWLSTPPGSGTAGNFYYNLQFTNLSGQSCSLRGYPGVSAVDLSGRQLGKTAAPSAGQPARRVTLLSGGTATATLQVTDTSVFPSASCGQTTAAGLQVYPPGQTASKVIPFPLRVCSVAIATDLHVRPVG